MTQSSPNNVDDGLSRIDHTARANGLEIPSCPSPAGVYVPAVLIDRFAFTSGMGTARNGIRHHLGYVGGDISISEACEAAEIAVLNAIATLRSVVDDLDQIDRIVRLTGYVRSAPGFIEQHKVIDAASRILTTLFGDKGKHARAAIGVAELPFGISVEVELTAHIMDGRTSHVIP